MTNCKVYYFKVFISNCVFLLAGEESGGSGKLAFGVLEWSFYCPDAFFYLVFIFTLIYFACLIYIYKHMFDVSIATLIFAG